jgi:electron transfer flavoprotein-quinone oxidoreductase
LINYQNERKLGNGSQEKFDVVIVGAGPAGTTAALYLARAGSKVAIFERGEEPGQKNMFGGILHYSEALNKLIPDFWTHAPVERYITRYSTTFLTSGSSLSSSFTDKEFGQPPYNGFTLLRAKFDRWYAQKAQEAGAFLIPETTVDDLVWDGNKNVIGIKTGRDEGILYADLVIVADGVNSLLAQKAGMRKDFSATDFSVAAKELLTLPREIIEERFDLMENEGLSHVFVGECTQGIEGGGFLYTNKASLSVGVVAKLSALQERKISIADLIEIFKIQPSVKRAIRGATLKEYSGHLIPEFGINKVPQLYGNGILLAGDAAGFVLSTGLTLEGMNFAIASGFAAAETAKMAKESGDFSKKGLAHYKKSLEKNFVLKDLKAFRHMPDLLANPSIYKVYPSLACGVARRIYAVTGQPRKKIMSIIREEMKGKISIWRFIKDMIKIWRTLVWT